MAAKEPSKWITPRISLTWYVWNEKGAGMGIVRFHEKASGKMGPWNGVVSVWVMEGGRQYQMIGFKADPNPSKEEYKAIYKYFAVDMRMERIPHDRIREA